MAEIEEPNSLEYTPTWVVAAVCFVIVLISLLAERGLHKAGKILLHLKLEALFEALQKLKEELMLLGFISLLLTVSQGAISRICIPPQFATHMLPCKRETETGNETTHFHQHFLGRAIISTIDPPPRRRLLSAAGNAAQCTREGKVPLLSLEALHQLHIFIFVMAVVHVIFCVTTMLLGGMRIRQWKSWEVSIEQPSGPKEKPRGGGEAKQSTDMVRGGAGVEATQSTEHHEATQSTEHHEAPQSTEHHHHLRRFLEQHTEGYWRTAAVIGWLLSFFKQFYGSITKSDYIALRHGFIKTHFPMVPKYDFHDHMMRTLQDDLKKIVGISWYLWVFVVIFLLLNVEGWHTYFWLAFLPLIILVLVGAKLEHIIRRLALEAVGKEKNIQDREAARVQPSDKHFWLHSPTLLLHLIHFILFQNAFEIAFFFWIWCTYGFRSCIMEKIGYIVPRLIMGVAVQVLCSYSTLPLYALVSQMGSKFKFDPEVRENLVAWGRRPPARSDKFQSSAAEQEMVIIETCAAAATTATTTNKTPSTPHAFLT